MTQFEIKINGRKPHYGETNTRFIDVPHACGGIDLNTFGFAIECPPVFVWMLNKHESEIFKWVVSKGGKMSKIYIIGKGDKIYVHEQGTD